MVEPWKQLPSFIQICFHSKIIRYADTLHWSQTALFSNFLTRISLAYFLWDKGKQHSPRCDAAECGVSSGAILFAQRNFIKIEIKKIKIKITPNTPKNESGLTELVMIGEFIRQIWVKHQNLSYVEGGMADRTQFDFALFYFPFITY